MSCCLWVCKFDLISRVFGRNEKFVFAHSFPEISRCCFAIHGVMGENIVTVTGRDFFWSRHAVETRKFRKHWKYPIHYMLSETMYVPVCGDMTLVFRQHRASLSTSRNPDMRSTEHSPPSTRHPRPSIP